MLRLVTLALCLTAAAVHGMDRMGAPLPASALGYIHARKHVRPLVEDDSKIVGGQNADPGQFPYQISFQDRYGNHFCGGAIYDANTIITASHCCYGKVAAQLQIVAGELNRLTDDGTEQTILVTKIIMHPDYDSAITNNDICLLKLISDIEFGPSVGAVTMPEQDEDFEAGSDAIVSGWGTLHSGDFLLPLDLQWVTVPVVSQDDCKAAYGDNAVTDAMICAGEEGRDSCQGDSGGPMTCDNKHCGVVSWGYGCAAAGYPGVYARTAKFIDWVAENA